MCLQALEDTIVGLDSAQTDGFRRLTANLSSTLSIEEDAISSAVKAEVWKSLEPVRQLPQILSQTLPRLTANDQSYEPSLTEESAKKIFAIELENLKNIIVNEQRDLLEEVSAWTAKIDSSQWNQLGAKLEELDDKLTKLEDLRDPTLLGSQSSDAFLREIKDDFRALSRDLEGIGSQMTLMQEAGSGNAMLPPGISQTLEDQLQREFESALTSFHEQLKDRVNGEAIDTKGIAKELSGIVVSVLFAVLNQQRIASASDGKKASTGLFPDTQKPNNTGVPIASWLSDQDMEKVPIKQSEEISLESSLSNEVTASQIPPTTGDRVNMPVEEESISGQEAEQSGMEQQLPEMDQVSDYQRGLDILKNGRNAFDQGKYETADQLFDKADTCFKNVIESNAADIKSIGNRGNTLMARAKAKLMMANLKFEEGIDGADDDEQEALEMLIQAGRLYRQILEIDPSQGKAFINWGRVVCLRAEISQSAEDFEGAYSLFCNAADKFTAGIDALVDDAAVSEAYRLAGTALVGAYYCASSIGLGQDAFSLLLEAEDYLVNAGARDDLGRAKLEECRQLIATAE